MKILLLGMTENQLREASRGIEGHEIRRVPSDETPQRAVREAAGCDTVVAGRFVSHMHIRSLQAAFPNMPINTVCGRGGVSSTRALLQAVIAANGRARTRS